MEVLEFGIRILPAIFLKLTISRMLISISMAEFRQTKIHFTLTKGKRAKEEITKTLFLEIFTSSRNLPKRPNGVIYASFWKDLQITQKMMKISILKTIEKEDTLAFYE